MADDMATGRQTKWLMTWLQETDKTADDCHRETDKMADDMATGRQTKQLMTWPQGDRQNG